MSGNGSGRWVRGTMAVPAVLLATATAAQARPLEMHIMEGFLPPWWAALWFLVALPFWIAGFRHLQRLVGDRSETRLLLGLAGAFCFVLSALKVPSITGSSSHPTGTGLGALLFGPAVMSVLGSIVLLFQALLLAHGGITTLGANAVAMAVAGPLVARGAWCGLRSLVPGSLAVFLAAALADLTTYGVTSIQLALAYPDPVGGIAGSLARFAGIFALTQVPLAVSEGILTLLVLKGLRSEDAREFEVLGSKGA